jgi:hypothetical protein
VLSVMGYVVVSTEVERVYVDEGEVAAVLLSEEGVYDLVVYVWYIVDCEVVFDVEYVVWVCVVVPLVAELVVVSGGP